MKIKIYHNPKLIKDAYRASATQDHRARAFFAYGYGNTRAEALLALQAEFSAIGTALVAYDPGKTEDTDFYGKPLPQTLFDK